MIGVSWKQRSHARVNIIHVCMHCPLGINFDLSSRISAAMENSWNKIAPNVSLVPLSPFWPLKNFILYFIAQRLLPNWALYL